MNNLSQHLTLHLEVKNKSTKSKKILLFQGFKNLFASNYGNDPDVEIDLKNSYRNYQELLADLSPNPALIRGYKIKSRSIKNKSITIVQTEGRLPIERPSKTTNGLNEQEEFVIGGDGGFNMELAQNETVEIYLRVYRKINRVNLLEEKDLVDEFPLQEFQHTFINN